MRVEWNLHQIWITMEKLFLKWAPGSKDPRIDQDQTGFELPKDTLYLITLMVELSVLPTLRGAGGAVRFLVVGTISCSEERPPRGQLWIEQYLTRLKYWPI